MPNDTENTLANTSEGEGKNTANVTGGGDSQPKNVELKQFTQEQLDNLIKQAKADAKNSAKKEIEKSYEGKLVFTEEEYTNKVTAAINEYKKEQTLAAAKKSIQLEYGLTDVQVARLSGNTEEDLKNDAELLFGALKTKVAPKLNTGANTNVNDGKDESPNAELNRRLQAKLNGKR